MKKILIVEDDQIVANIYRNKFSLDGFQVEVALDGHVGFELVRSFRPDAVILDLMVPRITGVELVKKIRSEPGLEKLPVIVFSSTYLTGMVQEAWKAGATKCLAKANCTPKQVIELIQGELSNNGAPAEATAAAAPATFANNRSETPAVARSGQADAEFQQGLLQSFIESLPATLSVLRMALKGMVKGENEPVRLKHAEELYHRIHALTGSAGLAGMRQMALMADALEVLLKELYEKPKNMTASTLRTVASAIDILGVLFERGIQTDGQEIPAANILVVDDDAISRRAVTNALEKAKLKSVNVEDPLVAYKMLSETQFDLIFLDVNMPGMTGFELCKKLRSHPAHKRTPVVFVTSANDFESRASSTMSGGTDFITKPFLFIELAVKALVYVLRGRLERTK